MTKEHTNREAELRILAESRSGADLRYVRDFVDFVWKRLLTRKQRNRESLPPDAQKKLATLEGLCA
jgi:hypothetical protein